MQCIPGLGFCSRAGTPSSVSTRSAYFGDWRRLISDGRHSRLSLTKMTSWNSSAFWCARSSRWDSFRRIGTAAGAVPATTTPDGVVNEGYELALGAFQAMRELGVLDAIAVVLPVVLLAELIFLAFLLIAAQLLVTQIESYLCIGAGVILLGFGGARWTEDIAATYMRYALLVGLKLMILYLVIGAGQTLFDGLKLDP